MLFMCNISSISVFKCDSPNWRVEQLRKRVRPLNYEVGRFYCFAVFAVIFYWMERNNISYLKYVQEKKKIYVKIGMFNFCLIVRENMLGGHSYIEMVGVLCQKICSMANLSGKKLVHIVILCFNIIFSGILFAEKLKC